MDLSWIDGFLKTSLGSGQSIDRLMSGLIDRCEAARPHADWARLRALPYDDLAPLIDWLPRPFLTEPTPIPLAGLWFGLFNPVREDLPTADLYVCGSDRFFAEEDDNSWAVGPCWWPEHRYSTSPILDAVYRIAYGAGVTDNTELLQNDAEYPLCLAYAAFAVRELLTRCDRALILGSSRRLGIAVGFDSGDFVVLGELTERGLEPATRKRERPADPVKAALDNLRSANEKRAMLAFFELKALGEQAIAAVPVLSEIAATSPAFGNRQAAIVALASIAPGDSDVRLTILKALEDENPFVRREALGALIKVEGLTPGDLAAIQAMKDDPDEYVAQWSEVTLRNIRLKGSLAEGANVP